MNEKNFKPIQAKERPRYKPKKKVKKIPKVQEEVTSLPENTVSVYKPFPGPQTEFLKANEDYVLFSGGRGSGKSLAMIALPLWFVEKPNFRALIIRKTMKDLRDLINKCKTMYNPLYSPKWKEQDKMFVFPSGATIEFNYFEQEKDADQYQGQAFDFIGIDEITQYPTDYILQHLSLCLRGNPDIPKYFRMTCNPHGPGVRWVKESFISKGEPGERFTKELKRKDGSIGKVTYKYFLSSVDDNPALLEQGYDIALENIANETLRKQYRYGDWDSVDGLAFDEFSDYHILKPFPIPKGWTKIRACDWGYGSMAVCLWLAVDFDNKVYVYREYTASKEKADIFAQKILDLEASDGPIQYGVLDSSCWASRGELGETVAETMMREGVRWMPSDRSKGSRKAGKMLIHSYLQGKGDTPDLYIFEDCKEIIKELQSLPLDSKDPEDVDTHAEDHAYDALRYALSSRPMNRPVDFFESTQQHIALDENFGY